MFRILRIKLYLYNITFIFNLDFFVQMGKVWERNLKLGRLRIERTYVHKPTLKESLAKFGPFCLEKGKIYSFWNKQNVIHAKVN